MWLIIAIGAIIYLIIDALCFLLRNPLVLIVAILTASFFYLVGTFLAQIAVIIILGFVLFMLMLMLLGFD